MINKKKEGGFYASKVRLFLNECDGIPLEEFCKAEKVSHSKMLSHHGSANGHPKYIPGHKRLHRRRLGCLRNAIIMGRNGAYSGIYDTKVINCFDMFTRIVYTEKDDNFHPIDAFGLRWRSGEIRYL